jgi:D-beta-D-heptose 7-phosphate kinase / D-beta-D-heptose 1-phosphate adenosyltransferase
VVSGSQQIVRIDFEETEPPTGQDALRLTETASRLIDDADALIISDYNKGACSQRVLSDIIAYARSRKVTVLCDPKGTNYGKYAGANIITPNRKEASAAAGIHMPDSVEPGFAARKLRKELGLEACLVTLGPDGMLLSEAGNDHEIHAFSHDVADVTGAGDCVIAGLAIALACGLPYLQSCIFANAVASISVSKAGSVAVNIDEVIAKYANALRRSTSTLIPRSQAGAEIAKWKDSGNSIVFTNGCFDILHAGHVLNLSHCATLGSRLVVGLNSDRSVRALKGTGRPVNSAEDRAAVLLALESVDAVIVFDEETPEELIRTVRPDVLVKGADYAEKEVVGRTFVESYGGRVELVEFERDISTTAILEKMKVSQK